MSVHVLNLFLDSQLKRFWGRRIQRGLICRRRRRRRLCLSSNPNPHPLWLRLRVLNNSLPFEQEISDQGIALYNEFPNSALMHGWWVRGKRGRDEGSDGALQESLMARLSFRFASHSFALSGLRIYIAQFGAKNSTISCCISPGTTGPSALTSKELR